MASLYIKDEHTADRVRDMARRLGSTYTDAVRRGMDALERELPEPPAERPDLLAWLIDHRRKHPLPPPTGEKADKAFFDRLWGEED